MNHAEIVFWGVLAILLSMIIHKEIRLDYLVKFIQILFGFCVIFILDQFLRWVREKPPVYKWYQKVHIFNRLRRRNSSTEFSSYANPAEGMRRLSAFPVGEFSSKNERQEDHVFQVRSIVGPGDHYNIMVTSGDYFNRQKTSLALKKKWSGNHPSISFFPITERQEFLLTMGSVVLPENTFEDGTVLAMMCFGGSTCLAGNVVVESMGNRQWLYPCGELFSYSQYPLTREFLKSLRKIAEHTTFVFAGAVTIPFSEKEKGYVVDTTMADLLTTIQKPTHEGGLDRGDGNTVHRDAIIDIMSVLE